MPLAATWMQVETLMLTEVSQTQKDSLPFCEFSFHVFLFLSFFFFFWLFRAAPMAYGSSQARCQIRFAAAGPCHSHNNTRSKPYLPPTPQLMAMLDP